MRRFSSLVTRAPLLLLGLMSSTVAMADTLYVCPACPYTTITSAILAADPGDTINLFFTSAHTEADIIVNKDLTIEGSASDPPIVQAATIPDTGAGRVFTILDGVSATLRNFTIRHGDVWPQNGGGVRIHASSDPTSVVTMENMRIVESRAANGGGIANEANLRLTDFSVNENHARSSRGSGIHNTGTLELVDGTVSFNLRTVRGGGIYNAEGASLSIDGVSINNNDAASGGGIYSRGAMSISRSNINSNQADDEYGGGIYNSADSLVVISDAYVFQNRLAASFNSVFPGGGGIYTTGPMRILRSSLSNNEAMSWGAKGGGIYSLGTDLTIVESRIANNEAIDGGGIYNGGSTLTIERSSITSNDALSHGGGIAHNGGITDLTNATLDLNTAGHDGGGAHVCSGEFALANSTVSENTANADAIGSGDGGGVFARNCTDEHTSLRSTIIANNHAISGSYPDCEGGFDSGSFSLIGDTGPTLGAKCLVGGFTAGMVYNTSPLLDAISGFDSTRSFPLLAGSPAIDGGTCTGAMGQPLATDQRGYSMPVDGDFDSIADCDMGSYEYLPEPAFAASLLTCLVLLARLRGTGADRDLP